MTTAAPANYLCLKQDTPVAGGLAALATVARQHGLPLTLAGLRKLAGIGPQATDAITLLFAAHQCGFDAMPLEGEFDQLREVATPAIVSFQNERYLVLFEADGVSTVVGDPATGDVRQMTQAEFCSEWTGDIFQLLPDSGRISATRETLRKLESTWGRLAVMAGIEPVSTPRLMFLVGMLAFLAAAPFARPLTLLTGACLLVSLWMAAFPKGCAKCGATASLSGALPLLWIGAAFYALLTAATLFAPAVPLRVGLMTAAGAHLALLSLLIYKRIACYPCLATAVLAFTATGLAFNGVGIEMLAFAASFGATLIAVTGAARLEVAEAGSRKFALARQVFAETYPAAPGQARLVIYSRPNCPICVFFKTVIRPSLADALGDALTIEERDATQLKIAVPMFFVSGSAKIALMAIATDEMAPRLAAAIQAAMDPAGTMIGELGGFSMVGFDEK